MGDATPANDRHASSDVETMALPFASGEAGELPSNLDVILEQVTKLRTLAVYLNARSLSIAPGE